jgi:hypothetical protein
LSGTEEACIFDRGRRSGVMVRRCRRGVAVAADGAKGTEE